MLVRETRTGSSPSSSVVIMGPIPPSAALSMSTTHSQMGTRYGRSPTMMRLLTPWPPTLVSTSSYQGGCQPRCRSRFKCPRKRLSPSPKGSPARNRCSLKTYPRTYPATDDREGEAVICPHLPLSGALPVVRWTQTRCLPLSLRERILIKQGKD